MSNVIDPQFRQRLETNPTRRFDVIVRCVDDPRDRLAGVMAQGLTVRHTYSLINALAASGLGMSILELADEPWVEAIEPDEEVRTMED